MPWNRHHHHRISFLPLSLIIPLEAIASIEIEEEKKEEKRQTEADRRPNARTNTYISKQMYA